MYVHNGKARDQFGVSSKSLSTLFFEAKFLTELELTNWARLADQEAPGIFLCLCSQGYDCGFSSPQLAFNVGAGDPNSGARSCREPSRHLLLELFSWSFLYMCQLLDYFHHILIP